MIELSPEGWATVIGLAITGCVSPLFLALSKRLSGGREGRELEQATNDAKASLVADDDLPVLLRMTRIAESQTDRLVKMSTYVEGLAAQLNASDARQRAMQDRMDAMQDRMDATQDRLASVEADRNQLAIVLRQALAFIERLLLAWPPDTQRPKVPADLHSRLKESPAFHPDWIDE